MLQRHHDEAHPREEDESGSVSGDESKEGFAE